ncbi:MAG: ATP-binding cassette domain-containing protein [Gammaproteobacteria bacterium]|nr:ATP-binding cassette domain-containing protein [Gammaproteobacteria bacterium]
MRRAAVDLGGRRILDDLDWTLLPGEHWALFGTNGSGKTTFLRLIAGQQWPTPSPPHQRTYDFGNGSEEHAVYAHQYIRLLSPELQDRYYRFNWNPTGWALIATGFADSPILRRQPEAPQVQAISDLVECLKIGCLINRRFLEMSRGEQRKLLLARAVIRSPRVLLLDEICDGLDQSARHQLLGFIDDLSGLGVHFVFASHRRQEIPRAINRYMILQNGRIADAGHMANLDRLAAADTGVVDKVSGQHQRGSDAPESVLIAIENADLYRGDVRVLTALNWRLRANQNWLIRGSNGSGKSTLIKLLHAEIRPALGGRIAWFGMRPPINVWQLRKRLGIVSDDLQSNYSEAVTVYQCVASGFFASIGRIPLLTARQKRCIDKWIEILELDALRAKRIDQLSYGQFRRVLMARALVQRPDILLLDEPMSGLDSDSMALIWSLLVRLSSQGTRIVMASHEREIIGGLFTHQLTLENGQATTVN